MGLGSDPDRDDYGLPPVDVVIPDDARELERDVQAYHRELRQQRRRQRWQRLVRPLQRHGMLPPLLVGMLLLVALSTALMTLLGPRPTSPEPTPPLASVTTAGLGQVGGLLPDVTLRVGPRSTRLRDLRPAVIALVPVDCRCDAAVDQLTRQARSFPIGVYLVASRRPARDLGKLAATAGHGAAVIVEDRAGILERTYRPSGLTAILVHTDGVVGGVLRNLRPEQTPTLEEELFKLQRPGDGDPAVPTAR